jgi:N-acetylglucosaminyldiphosphoundecaprenol N-acetyl-beta-D-mannosaminyltransferase
MRIRSKSKLFDLSLIHGVSVVFNSESTYWYSKSDEYRKYVDKADNIFLDGIGVSLKVYGILGFKKRYNGPELLSDIINNREQHNNKLILIGGRELTVSKQKDLKFSSQINLPHTSNIDELMKTVLERKSELKGNIILISLGLPKQEIFALRLSEELGEDYCQALLPIGAAVDFLSGDKVRSGTFWQQTGLEWFPRLIREPRMLSRIIKSFLGIYRFEISNITK